MKSKDTNLQNKVMNYGWDTLKEPCSSGYIAPKVLTLLELLSVKRVADIGSGNGALCKTLKSKGFDVVGIEQDLQGYNISAASYPEINFYNLGIEDDPNKVLKYEKHFDAIVSTEVIEHLYSPHLLPAFSEALVKDGGYLIISTPYHGYIKNLVLSILNKWDYHHNPLWHGGHIKFWSRKTLAKLLKQNGFKVISFHGVGRLPLIWKSMIIVAVKE